MKISGLIFGKNVTKLYYPLKQSILSVLSIVDEFIVVIGDCDEDDKTKEEVLSIGSSKIKIVESTWDLKKYPHGTVMAQQTDLAKSYCTGDWIICLQADEIIHENDVLKIKEKCIEHFENPVIEGLLLPFIHFWGDFYHYVDSHGWHKHEIRVIRNLPDIHSWKDSMSFRKIPNFDGISYRQKENTEKLTVALVPATVYHYGWARPPHVMKIKNKAFSALFNNNEIDEKSLKFDYGILNRYPVFKGTHPSVMKEWISNFNWKNELTYSGKPDKKRYKPKQDRLKYRFVTFLEKYVFFRPMWEFKNYILLKR